MAVPDAYIILCLNWPTPQCAIYAHLACGRTRHTGNAVHQMIGCFTVASWPLHVKELVERLTFGLGAVSKLCAPEDSVGRHSMILQGGLWTCVSHIYVAGHQVLEICFLLRSAFIPYR
jgi:hypothetical protein